MRKFLFFCAYSDKSIIFASVKAIKSFLSLWMSCVD
nr:MAG TPA: hypothetical protein [Caudoviricetes sp.]